MWAPWSSAWSANANITDCSGWVKSRSHTFVINLMLTDPPPSPFRARLSCPTPWGAEGLDSVLGDAYRAPDFHEIQVFTAIDPCSDRRRPYSQAIRRLLDCEHLRCPINCCA